MKTEFKDGSVLLTGNDMIDALSRVYNHRDNYNHKDCNFCIYQHGDNVECDDCSVYDGERGCSCHINPPCSFCIDNHFEPSVNLINYKHIRNGGKWKWECFKSTEEVKNKLDIIENSGLHLNCETLQTDEIVVYLSNTDEDEIIEICNKTNFKSTVVKIINDYEILKL